MHAVIVGNGPSRKEIDLNTLNKLGVLYGCNALYRDYCPDYLVAIDTGMIHEILNSRFPRGGIIIPPLNEQFEPKELGGARSNAGMNACFEAIKRGSKSLFITGFDFLLKDYNHVVGNIYEHTNNYGSQTRCSYDDAKRRQKYFAWMLKNNPHVSFKVILPNANYQVDCPPASNLSFIDYQKLEPWIIKREQHINIGKG